MISRRQLSGGLALGVLAAASAAPAQTPAPAQAPAATPLPVGPLRMPDMPLHDPFVIADKARGTYYLYTSNNARMTGVTGVGTMVYTSRDLLDWTAPKVVFRMPTSGIWASAGGWAPEVHKWRGRYWLFVTLHNDTMKLPPNGKLDVYRRGTVLAVADTPAGPFELVRGGDPVVPAELMTLDGTLYVDEAGKPWTVYAHEWLQTIDGTMEAMPLDDNLAAAGKPILLFKASTAKWVGPPQNGPVLAEGLKAYVTDGPQLYPMKDKSLIMLWSSYDGAGYVQSQARSASGKITGPWEQLEPMLYQDSGHGMVFDTFDGKRMLIVHRPFRNARGKLYEVQDAGDRFRIVRHRTDLDGDPPGAP